MKCNFRGYRCGTTTIVDIRRQKVNYFHCAWFFVQVKQYIIIRYSMFEVYTSQIPPFSKLIMEKNLYFI